MGEIVQRLRSVRFLSDPTEYDRVVKDAADEIDRLAAAALREERDAALEWAERYEQVVAERDRLRMFIASDVSRLIGFCTGVSYPCPILDDDPKDWIERMRESMAEEVERIKPTHRAALSKGEG